jgi:hypothetical protein
MKIKSALLGFSLLFAVVEPAYAGLKTIDELPGGKSGQWYVCFDDQGYLDGYRSIKDYGLMAGGYLAFQHIKGNQKVLSYVYPTKGLTTDWDPDNLPKWIENIKYRYVDDERVKTEEYKCRRVEPYENYLEVE